MTQNQNGLFQEKRKVREQFEKRLANIPFFSLIEKSAKLSARFESFSNENREVFRKKFLVSFYPFETEPQINVEKEDQGEPYRVSYVRIVDWKTGQMEARHARRDLPGQWEEYELKNGNRIFQPKAIQDFCEVSDVSVVLVPGLAFTADGKRLGRGAGFYDRFLALHPGALRVGIAFQEQLTENIPSDPWDETLDVLLTDEAFYSTKCYGQWQNHGKVLDRHES